MKTTSALIFLVALFVAGPAYPFGSDGHHATGAIADALLKNTNAAHYIKALLKNGTLEHYAIWADCAKGYCKDWHDDEMKALHQLQHQ